MKLIDFVEAISPNARERGNFTQKHRWPLRFVLYVLKRPGQKGPVVVNTPTGGRNA